MLSKRLVATALVCATLAVGATACGGDKDDKAAAGSPAAAGTTPAAPSTPSGTPAPTAPAGIDAEKLAVKEIMKQAHAAMTSATSVRVAGELVSEGSKIKMDIALDAKGQCAGTMSMAGTGTFEIVSDGTRVWIKPDAAFWESFGGKNGATAAQLFKGRYLSGLNSDAEIKEMTTFCTIAELSKSFLELDDDAKVTKGPAGTVNGLKTLTLDSTDTDGEQSTLHIAVEGKPYPLRIEGGGKGPGRIDFTYDKPVEVKAPAADNVIDISKFRTQFPARA